MITDNSNLIIIIKKIIAKTPWGIVSIGSYIRNLYFQRYLGTIRFNQFKKILDAGCGTGDYARKLSVKYPFISITAVDIKHYPEWDSNYKNIFYQKINLHNLKLVDQYNFCYSIDVLEHIKNNKKIIINIYRSLKAGGYFYLHVPSRYQRRIFSAKYFIEHEKWGKKEHVGELYTLEELKNLLVSVGFTIKYSRETFGIFGRIAWEINTITYKNTLLSIILMPLLKTIAYLDLFYPKINNGNGLSVLAYKK